MSYRGEIREKFKIIGRKPWEMTDEDAKQMFEAAEAGESHAEICLRLGISKRAFYAYKDPKDNRYYPEFAEWWEICETAYQAFWERSTREATFSGQSFASTFAIFSMANKFKDDYSRTDKKADAKKIILELGDGTDAEKADNLLGMITRGDVAPDVGASIMQIIKVNADVRKLSELEERIKALEDLANVGNGS